MIFSPVAAIWTSELRKLKKTGKAKGHSAVCTAIGVMKNTDDISFPRTGMEAFVTAVDSIIFYHYSTSHLGSDFYSYHCLSIEYDSRDEIVTLIICIYTDKSKKFIVFYARIAASQQNQHRQTLGTFRFQKCRTCSLRQLQGHFYRLAA